MPATTAEVPATEILGKALDCDRENARALALDAELTATPSPTPLAKSYEKAWSIFAGENIAPLQEIVLAILLWAFVALALVWMLPYIARNHLAGRLGEKVTVARTVGVLLVSAGAVCGTAGVTWWGPAAFPVGLVLTAAGVWLWDFVRRSQLKLRVTVQGSEPDKAAANLRGIIADMGAAFPRGVEVPIGPDVTFLTDVDFTVVGAKDVTNALKAVLQAVKPYVPWELLINVVTDDRLAVVLSRNGEQVASEIVDRTSLRLDTASMKELAEPGAKKDDPVVVPALWTFPAALAVVRIAEIHRRPAGLGGATNWRSIAYHHIATTQLRPLHPTAERAILGRAVDLDPGNLAAALAFWNSSYRYDDEAGRLNEYRTLLLSILDMLPRGTESPLEPEAIQATRRSQGQTLIDDLGLLTRELKFSAGSRTSSPEIVDELLHIIDRVVRPESPARADWIRLLRRMLSDPAAVIAAVAAAHEDLSTEGLSEAIRVVSAKLGDDETACAGDIDCALTAVYPATPEPALQLRARYSLVATMVNLGYLGYGTYRDIRREYNGLWAQAEEFSAIDARLLELMRTMRPRVALLGKSVAQLAQLTDQKYPDLSPVVGGPYLHYLAACAAVPGPGRERNAEWVDIAVRHLGVADLDAQLKGNHPSDPQFARLRQKAKYRAKYATKIESDILAIEPFATWATVLRTAGLVGSAQIADAAPRDLQMLGISPPQAQWLITAAQLAESVRGRKKVRAWYVPITGFLLKRGICALGPSAQHLEGDLMKELAKLTSHPKSLATLWN
jgi:hypothetical protein